MGKALSVSKAPFCFKEYKSIRCFAMLLSRLGQKRIGDLMSAGGEAEDGVGGNADLALRQPMLSPQFCPLHLLMYIFLLYHTPKTIMVRCRAKEYAVSAAEGNS